MWTRPSAKLANMKANSDFIADRFENFFQRYEEFLRDCIASHVTENHTSDSDLERENLRERKATEFNSEYGALKNEWDETEGKSDSEIEKIRSLASVTSKLASEITSILKSRDLEMQTEMDSVQSELGKLRQGKNVSKQFGVDPGSDAKIMNRKA